MDMDDEDGEDEDEDDEENEDDDETPKKRVRKGKYDDVMMGIEDDDEFEFSKYDEDMGLFVRNLAFDTKKEELEKFFEKYLNNQNIYYTIFVFTGFDTNEHLDPLNMHCW